MITKQIYDPVYDVRLDVVAQCDFKQANAFIKKQYKYDPELDSLSYGMLIQYSEGRHFIMWLKKAKQNTITHEVSHLIDDIYAYRGINHSCQCSGCSEHRAYQTTAWVDMITKAMKG